MRKYKKMDKKIGIEIVSESKWSRLKALGLLLLTAVLYWLPPMLPYRDYYYILPPLQLVCLALALVVAYKSHVFTHFVSTFKPLNLLIILGILVLGLVAAHLAYLWYYNNVPVLDTITNQQADDYASRFMPAWYSAAVYFLIAPFFEELIFREYFYRLFKSSWLAAGLSILIFTLLHSGFTWAFVLYFPMGFFMVLAYQRRKVVTDSMLVHAGFNLAVSLVPLLLHFQIN